MNQRGVEAVVGALNRAGARYLIAGGLAVVAHGFVRFTTDIDLVLDPEPDALRRATEALAACGYVPRAPVRLADFADPENRRRWSREKGLTVFSLFSAEHAATEVDLFVEPPFDFERAYAAAVRFEVAPGLEATFVGLDDLVAMKRSAGRTQDLQDAAELEALHRAGEDRDG